METQVFEKSFGNFLRKSTAESQVHKKVAAECGVETPLFAEIYPKSKRTSGGSGLPLWRAGLPLRRAKNYLSGGTRLELVIFLGSIKEKEVEVLRKFGVGLEKRQR